MNWPIQLDSCHVHLFVCLSFCLRHCQTPTSGCHGNFWSKNIFLILACDETTLKTNLPIPPPRICQDMRFWITLLWIVGELAGTGLWLWLLAFGCLHFNGTLATLQLHFINTSRTQKNKEEKHCVVASFRIGWEIQCPPYAGFLLRDLGGGVGVLRESG